jgi:hypothetical protein
VHGVTPEQRADLAGGPLEVVAHAGWSAGQLLDPGGDPGAVDVGAVGVGGDDERPGHGEPGAYELAQVGALASRAVHVVATEVVSWTDVSHGRVLSGLLGPAGPPHVDDPLEPSRVWPPDRLLVTP